MILGGREEWEPILKTLVEEEQLPVSYGGTLADLTIEEIVAHKRNTNMDGSYVKLLKHPRVSFKSSHGHGHGDTSSVTESATATATTGDVTVAATTTMTTTAETTEEEQDEEETIEIEKLVVSVSRRQSKRFVQDEEETKLNEQEKQAFISQIEHAAAEALQSQTSNEKM